MELEPKQKPILGVHPDVLKLGLVSFLTDVSSEMIFSVFAIAFTTIAGASSALLGLIEGMADFSASSLNCVAGWLSDRSGRRKPLALAGYAFSAAAKTILLVATTVTAMSLFRVAERLGKGLRGPPRDAWLAGVADKAVRGYSFGMHKALDKAGAVAGPLIAYGLLTWLGGTAQTFKTLFWVAFVPALLSVILLSRIDDQPGVRHRSERVGDAWRTLRPGFKRYLVVASLFSLAYFSFGFLLLRAHTLGFSTRDVVLLYAWFNVAVVASAPLVGKLGDLVGRRYVVMWSYLIYLLMSLGFAFATAKWQIIALFAVYGVFFSMDEAQSKAFIADIEPERRATAIGIYNLVTGMAYVPASIMAGLFWLVQPSLAFLVAALLCLAAIAAFVLLRPR
ncbi:MAG: MFS transporter [Betaproteobacteria bacterium]|nr:MFS transporter [Betaproteobacteria bacterium]